MSKINIFIHIGTYYIKTRNFNIIEGLNKTRRFKYYTYPRIYLLLIPWFAVLIFIFRNLKTAVKLERHTSRVLRNRSFPQIFNFSQTIIDASRYAMCRLY